MIKPWLTHLSILSFIVGAVAKGGGSIDDVRALTPKLHGDNAQMVSGLACTRGSQSRNGFPDHLVCHHFRPVRGHSSTTLLRPAWPLHTRSLHSPFHRRRYIVSSYLLSAILRRTSRAESNVSLTLLHNLGLIVNFLWNIAFAFEPAVCLWLIHLRGKLTTTTEGKSVNPWVSQLWKRIVDWLLVALTFIISIVLIAILAILWTQLDQGRRNSGQTMDLHHVLGITTTALGPVLTVDIILSFICLKVSQRRVQFADPVTTRLVVVVLPFVTIGLIEFLVNTILPYTYALRKEADFNLFNLLIAIIDGVCRVGIIGGLLSTMTIPNAFCVPGTTTSALALPVGEDAGYMLHKS
ncbi:hypothetical protein PIIN_07332 [Serendipita indica DSM 11827]|uniref:Uncharacterized protein n=1 Tax=Serendipita indica (strain DSM 11827) TaxID=1109443 RepID=G4TPY5_SERID|nr:hypothetical protein PIIN_07332 [Serendipita indica DSM 11827]